MQHVHVETSVPAPSSPGSAHALVRPTSQVDGQVDVDAQIGRVLLADAGLIGHPPVEKRVLLLQRVDLAVVVVDVWVTLRAACR